MFIRIISNYTHFGLFNGITSNYTNNSQTTQTYSQTTQTYSQVTTVQGYDFQLFKHV